MKLKTERDLDIRRVAGIEKGIDLYLPPDDEPNPELSIVIPALNDLRFCAH